MEKNKRALALCGMIAAFCLGSCLSVTDELDLNKEISLDMQIGPGGLTIPLGSLDTLYLDSLIKIDGDESILDTLDGGLFGFSMGDSISKVTVEIGAVTINIDDPEIDPLETKFDNPEVQDVNIDPMPDSTLIQIEKLDVSGINSKLPLLEKSTEVGPYDVPAAGGAIPTIPVEVEEQQMACSFEYKFPDDMEKLYKVWFGTVEGSRTGQKLSLDVDLDGIFQALSSPAIKVTSLKITFPDEFHLSKDPGLSKYIPDQCVQITNNNSVFKISMSSETVTGIGDDHKLPITFMVDYADFSKFDEEILFSDYVKYELALSIDGQSDNAGTFGVSVDLATQLQMSDVDVKTKQKNIDLEEAILSSSCVVSDLGGISKVDVITFDADKSLLYLSISDLDIDPFQLDPATSKINLTFDPKYTFDTNYCKDETGKTVGSWSGNNLSLDASKSIGHTVRLKVKTLDVYETVDETASIEIKTDVSYDGHVTIMSKNDVVLKDLDVLEDKNLEIVVWGKFIVANAKVEISEMRNDFRDSTEISINEKVDDALVMMNRIDLVEPAAANMNLMFDGVPNSIQKLKFYNFTIEFPDFIQLDYVGTDSRISVSGNKLRINGLLTTELHSAHGFSVNGLQITGMYFKEPLEMIDGYLVLDKQKVRITGAVTTVDNQEIDNSELDKIIVTPTVSFSPIVVKSVYGKVNPKIDGVHEEVELNLGDADFFQNENNTLSLSDPQLTINLTSTVTVPIDIDLKLSSLDSKGGYIGKDITPDGGTIHIAKCDSLAASRTTTLIIYKNERAVTSSDDTLFIRMSRLSELMSTIPDKIVFDLKAGINQSVNHYVDLTRELAVSGNYKVAIPLQFDSLYLEYSDTIKDLGESLEEVADMIGDAELQLLADVESTIPLGVTLSAKAYDKDWNELTDINISTCEIKAGNDSVTKSTMVLGLGVKAGSLKKLESIVFTAACESGDSGSGIRRGQWLYLKKLRIKFPQGIKVDLTDTGDKDKKKDSDKNKKK